MLEYFFDLDSIDISELNPTRLEAIERYERCLAEGRPQQLEEFVEGLLTQSPPQLDLLYDVANDLQQRLLALREYHFDVRKRVIQAMFNIYHTDITHLTPPDKLHSYHLLNPQSVIESVRRMGFIISREEEAILTDMIKSSLEICGQLFRDIKLTAGLQTMLEDWLTAYNITSVRQSQNWTPISNAGIDNILQ
ncbi:MAG TPA: hypothetical protein VJZ27_11905 [Aggregatilineales bacterium]|nr:hypothetical protein [Aggregatilineales bacterium]